MKHLILALYSIIVCNTLPAQNCQDNIFFKKGAQLKYKTYLPFSKTGESTEITTTIYEVADTATINNALTATIIKKQSAVVNKKYKFQKEERITCNGSNISYPLNLFTPDTIYMCDVSGKTSDTGYAMVTRFLANPFLVLPLDIKSGVKLNEVIADQEVTEGAQQGFTEYSIKGEPTYHPPVPAGVKKVTKATYRNIKIDGKGTVETAAGTFEAFKISCEFEAEVFDNMKVKQKAVFYYNNELGFIKSETQVLKKMRTLFELASIKK